MAGVNVFHVAFGFNATELTTCLEEDKYIIAEQMIYENAHTPYLDEGCYHRTALNIVLSGRNASEHTPKRRNFYMAKVLAQCGASPNFRVPESDFGVYMGPGKTPLELVVDFYNELTNTKNGNYEQLKSTLFPLPEPVIGLDNKVITEYDDLLEQLSNLVFIFLSHGGDANILDEDHKTPLHRTAMLSNNMLMTQMLCENGADLNASDRGGDTPLDVAISHTHRSVRKQVIEYLLSRPDLEVNHRNKLGRTPLFHAMSIGDIDTAWKLLERNCDVTYTGQLYQHFDEIYAVQNKIVISRKVSPIFTVLCSNQAKEYLYKAFCTRSPYTEEFFTSALIDTGKFSHSSVIEELKDFLKSDFPQLMHLQRLEESLLHLMFGGSTATLRQRSARAVFIKWVRKFFRETLSSPMDDEMLELAEMHGHIARGEYRRRVRISYTGDHVGGSTTFYGSREDAEDQSIAEKSNIIIMKDGNGTDVLDTASVKWYLQTLHRVHISPEELKNLVLRTHLPADCLITFEIELFRFQLFLLMHKCWMTSSSIEFDSDISEDNDSDLEYW